MPKTFLRLQEVLHQTTLSKVELHQGLTNGTFPPPVPVSAARMGWRADDVDTWIKARPRATDISALLSADIEDESYLAVADTDDTLH